MKRNKILRSFIAAAVVASMTVTGPAMIFADTFENEGVDTSDSSQNAPSSEGSDASDNEGTNESEPAEGQAFAGDGTDILDVEIEGSAEEYYRDTEKLEEDQAPVYSQVENKETAEADDAVLDYKEVEKVIVDTEDVSYVVDGDSFVQGTIFEENENGDMVAGETVSKIEVAEDQEVIAVQVIRKSDGSYTKVDGSTETVTGHFEKAKTTVTEVTEKTGYYNDEGEFIEASEEDPEDIKEQYTTVNVEIQVEKETGGQVFVPASEDDSEEVKALYQTYIIGGDGEYTVVSDTEITTIYQLIDGSGRTIEISRELYEAWSTKALFDGRETDEDKGYSIKTVYQIEVLDENGNTVKVDVEAADVENVKGNEGGSALQKPDGEQNASTGAQDTKLELEARAEEIKSNVIITGQKDGKDTYGVVSDSVLEGAAESTDKENTFVKTFGEDAVTVDCSGSTPQYTVNIEGNDYAVEKVEDPDNTYEYITAFDTVTTENTSGKVHEGSELTKNEDGTYTALQTSADGKTTIEYVITDPKKNDIDTYVYTTEDIWIGFIKVDAGTRLQKGPDERYYVPFTVRAVDSSKTETKYYAHNTINNVSGTKTTTSTVTTGNDALRTVGEDGTVTVNGVTYTVVDGSVQTAVHDAYKYQLEIRTDYVTGQTYHISIGEKDYQVAEDKVTSVTRYEVYDGETKIAELDSLAAQNVKEENFIRVDDMYTVEDINGNKVFFTADQVEILKGKRVTFQEVTRYYYTVNDKYRQQAAELEINDDEKYRLLVSFWENQYIELNGENAVSVSEVTDENDENAGKLKVTVNYAIDTAVNAPENGCYEAPDVVRFRTYTLFIDKDSFEAVDEDGYEYATLELKYVPTVTIDDSVRFEAEVLPGIRDLTQENIKKGYVNHFEVNISRQVILDDGSILTAGISDVRASYSGIKHGLVFDFEKNNVPIGMWSPDSLFSGIGDHVIKDGDVQYFSDERVVLGLDRTGVVTVSARVTFTYQGEKISFDYVTKVNPDVDSDLNTCPNRILNGFGFDITSEDISEAAKRALIKKQNGISDDEEVTVVIADYGVTVKDVTAEKTVDRFASTGSGGTVTPSGGGSGSGSGSGSGGSNGGGTTEIGEDDVPLDDGSGINEGENGNGEGSDEIVNIDDDQVPLAPAPVTGEDGEMSITDDEAAALADIPHTGDDMTGMAAAAGAAGLGTLVSAAAAFFRRRRENR